MTAINISSDIATSFTTVSDIFIDQYMPKANGEFVKVYLYLLRATGSGAGIATISEIADHFSNTEADIIRALNYWASEGILQVQTGADGQIIGVNLCSLSVSGMQAAQSNIQSAVADNAAQNNLQNSVVNNAAQNILQNSVVNNAAQNISTVNTRMHDSVVEKLKSQTPDKAASSQKEYTLDEIKEFRKNPDISELFFIIETYLKHTLSSTDTNMVLYWLDELHFSTDLVEYLVEYCITKGHSSLRYMNKVALGWADAGSIPLQDLLLGQQINGLGAGQVGALFLGGSLLAARGIIRWQIALGFFAGVAGLAALFCMSSPATDASPLFHLCTGSVMLGGFFLITDPANAPSRPLPMFLYGLLGGALVMTIRKYGIYLDGVPFAILLANLVAPLLDSIRPKPFGVR